MCTSGILAGERGKLTKGSAVFSLLILSTEPQEVCRVGSTGKLNKYYTLVYISFYIIHVCTFSDAECRNFLLYYIPSVLSGILPDQYVGHAMLLSKSVRLLLGNYISMDDVNTAEELLHIFVRLMDT